jgi:hypothetical protein
MGISQRWRDDEGVGIVVVLGISTFIMILIVAAASIARNALAMAQQRSNYEQSLAAAEAGIDETLGRLQRAYDDYSSDYPVPSLASAQFPSPACAANPVTAPTSFDTAEAERTWAVNALTSLAESHPECLQSVSVPGQGGSQETIGQYIVLKPSTPLVNGRYPGFGRVYSLGWAPARNARGVSSRMVKAEYVFLPYAPQAAILTSGDLEVESSTTVTTAAGYDTSIAGVHSNGVITTQGNPTVTGKVTSTGTSTASSNRFYSNPGGAVASAPTASVPRVNARSFYFNAPSTDFAAVNSRWYDLCPDATVRSWSSDGPCTGATNGDGATVGWAYDNGSRTWIAGRSSVSGVFYAHEANVGVGTGNASIPNITVIASSANVNDCASKAYGNIQWDHYDMRAPAFRNLFLLADADIETFSNFTAGNQGGGGSAVTSGMFIAGDQISLQTSSQGAVGSVIAGDRCTNSPMVTTNVVKNPAVYFDPDGDSPFSDIITTTLWLEYDVG